jgi:hypothetical protein
MSRLESFKAVEESCQLLSLLTGDAQATAKAKVDPVNVLRGAML